MSNQKFSQERLMNVLLAPQISEKATYVADKNEQVIFRVASDATKPEIKAAVELMFKVNVENVQVAVVTILASSLTVAGGGVRQYDLLRIAWRLRRVFRGYGITMVLLLSPRNRPGHRRIFEAANLV